MSVEGIVRDASGELMVWGGLDRSKLADPDNPRPFWEVFPERAEAINEYNRRVWGSDGT